MNQLLTGHSCLNSHKANLDGMSAAINEIIIIFIYSRRFRKAVYIFERLGRLLGQTICGDLLRAKITLLLQHLLLSQQAW